MDILKVAQKISKKYALDIDIGVAEKGKDFTQQGPWKKTTKCNNCGKEARLALALSENISDDRDYIVEANPDDGGWWPGDLTSYAIYICKDIGCARAPTTLFNLA